MPNDVSPSLLPSTTQPEPSLEALPPPCSVIPLLAPSSPISNAPSRSPSQPAPKIVTWSGHVIQRPACYCDWTLSDQPYIAGEECYPLLWVWTSKIMTVHWELSLTLIMDDTLIVLFSCSSYHSYLLLLLGLERKGDFKKRRHVTCHASCTRFPKMLFSCHTLC